MNEDVTPEESISGLADKGPWQKLPQESPKSYGVFIRYLELGPYTTHQQLADDTGKSAASIGALSSRHFWAERSAAYRLHISNASYVVGERQRVRQTEICQRRDQLLRQEFWEEGKILRAAFHKAMHKWMSDPEAKIAPYEMARFLDLYFKLSCRSSAPTGFTCEEPVTSSVDYAEQVKQIYDNLDLTQLLDMIKRLHPTQAALIEEKLGPSSNGKS